MTVEGMNAGVPTNYAPAFIHYVENIYVGYKELFRNNLCNLTCLFHL